MVFFHQFFGILKVFTRGQRFFLDQDVFFRYLVFHGITPRDERFGEGGVFRFASGGDQFFDVTVFVQPDAVIDPFLKDRRGSFVPCG